MALQFQETFQVRAPAESVWAYLIDPRRVVECLPGAELLEVQDERTFLGRVKVKIGPVTAAYKGKARLTEVDEGARRVRMSGEGQETAGSGSARMTMSSEILPLPDGGCEVRVQMELDVVGKIVQFGRGMIEEVSRQLFRQFAGCVQATLAREAPAEAAPAQAPAPAAPGVFPPPPGDRPVAAAPVHPDATRVAPPPVEKPAVSALSLLWRALVAWLRRLVGLPARS